MPRRANHDVADMDMRRLRNDEVDGVGHIIPVQQRAKFIVEVVHQIITVARRFLKPADHKSGFYQ